MPVLELRSEKLRLLPRNRRGSRVAVARAHDQVWIADANFDAAFAGSRRVLLRIITKAVLHAEFGSDRFKGRTNVAQVVSFIKAAARLLSEAAQVRFTQRVTFHQSL